jgi:hypothetical protein
MDTHHNRAHIVVDNSNLFISGMYDGTYAAHANTQHTAGKYQAQQTGLEDGNADPRLRVDYREMWAMLCEMHGAEGQGSMTVCAGEGVPPSVWAALSAGGVRIDMYVCVRVRVCVCRLTGHAGTRASATEARNALTWPRASGPWTRPRPCSTTRRVWPSASITTRSL